MTMVDDNGVEMQPAGWNDLAHPSLVVTILACVGFWGSIILKLLGILKVGWPGLCSTCVIGLLVLIVFLILVGELKPRA